MLGCGLTAAAGIGKLRKYSRCMESCQMNGRATVYNWLYSIQSRLLPATCVLCGAAGHSNLNLCRGCRADLRPITGACRQCGAPLPSGEVCGECLRRPPPFTTAVVPWHYAPPLDRLIQDLKFGARLTLAGTLGHLLADAVEARAGVRPQWLVPVPLHPSRLRQRGFNQALELARPLARRLGLPVATTTCQRIRATAVQSVLHAGERRRNMRGAFQVNWPNPPTRVAIVDDVLSTGSTVAELARALRRAGVAEIQVWALARASRR